MTDLADDDVAQQSTTTNATTQSPRRVRALGIGAVALISLTAFEALAVATVMPAVAADLHGLNVYALAFGAPFATSVVGMALAGAWADDVGPRRPLVVGVALFAVGLLLCGGAPHIAVFVLGRGVQGLGAGMQTVALYALVGSVVPDAQRPRIFAWFSAAWVLPGMIGPAVSGAILHTVGWRPVFLVVPALTLPAGLIMWPVVRAAHRRSGAGTGAGTTGPGTGTRRRVLLAVGAGSSATVLQVTGTREQPGWRALAVMALVGVVLCAHRLLPAGTLRLRRGLPSVVAVRGLIAAAFAGAESYLPLMLVREHRWDPAAAGLLLTLGTLTWTAASWVQARSKDPQARYRFSRIGTSLLSAGVLVFLTAAFPGTPAWTAAAGWAVAGFGIGLAYSSTSLLSLQLSPPERHGEASSALTTSESLTAATALALGGALFAALLPAAVRGGALGAAGSAGSVAQGGSVGPGPYLVAVGVAALAALVAVVGAWRMTERPS